MATKVHYVRFYNPTPRAIYCLSLDESKTRLAVARCDASIEIWNISHAMFVERVITPTIENYSIQGLAWCGERLFSVGLHGLLVEYDLKELNIRNQAAVTGGSAFCLDFHEKNQQVAVGTEQGYLNIFDVGQDEVRFEKFLDKQEGKILCLKYEKTGQFVVSGGVDAIRIWDVKTGHALHRMTTGRSEQQRETTVWSLIITSDFTIISGDSRGKLIFWDGNVGAQLESYQSHRADILAISLSEDEEWLYCSGVDPIITIYERIELKEGSRKYVKSIQRNIHNHDVRAMVISKNKLYSAGADSCLACSFHKPKTLVKNFYFNDNSVSLAWKSRNILLKFPKHLEVWKLGSGEDVQTSYKGEINLKETPLKLLAYQKKCKDFEGVKHQESIISCDLSPDGRFLVVSTSSGVKLFQLKCDKDVELEKLDLELHDFGACLHTNFTSQNQLILVSSQNEIVVFNVDKLGAKFSQKILVKNMSNLISIVETSRCGRYLVLADLDGNILVFSFKTKWDLFAKLPRYDVSPPTAIAVHPSLLNVVVAYGDNKVIEFSLKTKKYTLSSKSLNLKFRIHPIKNITFDERNNDIIFLQDENSLIVLNKNQIEGKNQAKKGRTEEDSTIKQCEVTYSKRNKHLVHLEWLQKDELIAVEVDPLLQIELLPPAFNQKKFGHK